jgi:tetratricopeptide (TPR) repeat protein
VDLLDFSEKSLYFDEPLAEQAVQLIEQAAAEYGNSNVEPLLLKAYEIAPEHLTVLVALYRYYYYQHRLEDALLIAHQALAVSGQRLDFPKQWYQLTDAHIGAGALVSMGMVRFYLLALKAAGYLNLRLQKWQSAIDMLMKVTELDEADRLGTAALLEIAYSVYPGKSTKEAAG